MPGKAKSDKPRGRMSSYAFFVQICREEHKKSNPSEKVVFAEFTKKCATKWKEMSPSEKRKFEEMANNDKKRYENEMSRYNPPPGETKGKASRKRTKDPNAPKRSLSAFFFFCADERPKCRVDHPDWSVADVAKFLGKLWEKCQIKPKYEAQAAADKKRYEKQMAQYKQGLPFDKAVVAPPPRAPAPAPPPKKAKQEESEEEEEDDEDDEEEESEEEEDDE